MGFIADRKALIKTYLTERANGGLEEFVGPLEREIVFLLDGVSGYQAGVVIIRKVLRELNADIGSVLFDWQTPIRPDIFTDLMWLRRNRLMGLRLARKLLAFRRVHPAAKIHLFAFSGGAGIAVFACERLAAGSRAGRQDACTTRPGHRQVACTTPLIDTLVLACPAISPAYNLAPALRSVNRCYALVSRRDTFLLGMGTRLFGTTDRRFSPAAGQTGFRIPPGLSEEDARIYERLREIRWTRALEKLGHRGGHVGWGNPAFLCAYLLPILHGQPDLATHEVALTPCRTGDRR